MIYIRKGNEPNSLTQYKKDKFAYYDGCNKDDIRDNLLNEQGHLCAYCMRRIFKSRMKIEHWYPEESLTELQKLDYLNMIGCCEGHYEGGKFKDDTCDAHKKNTVISVNPMDPNAIDKIEYKMSTGEIYSDDEAIQKDINDTLNLNCESHLLKENRKAVLDEVKRTLSVMQKSGNWSKKMLQKVLDTYTNTDSNGKKKEYAGIVIWYVGRRLKET